MSKKQPMTRLILVLSALFLGGAAAAQNMFAPVVTINGAVVTQYELDQRVAFLQVLRAPGNLEEAAEEALIDERIQTFASDRANISISKEELDQGMQEFAARANLEVDAFVEALGQSGVAPETFRDFVESGLRWRKFVRQQFGPKATVTEAEIDRELASQETVTGARVSLAEIILPATPDLIDQTRELIAEIRRVVRTRDQFGQAAARFSLSQSRENGGRIDALDINTLPPQLAEILLTMKPGEISDPVPVGEQAVAIFQMRGLTELPPRPAPNLTVDYAQYAIPGGNTAEAQAEAQKVIGKVAACDDFYPIVRGGSEDRLTRVSKPLRQVPSNIAVTLAKLDPNETSIDTTANGGQTLLITMLCSRTPELDENARETARLAVFNDRMTSLANGYLEALKADAIIRHP